MKTLAALAFGLLIASSGAVFAAENAEGKALHEANCKACHDHSVYVRADRRVKTLADLGKQVRRCEQAQGLAWFDEDVESVVQYLNANYYKF